MTQTTNLSPTDHEAKQCHFHIGVPQAVRTTIAAFGKWAVGPFIMLSLVTSTLFMFTSCGSIASTHVAPTPSPVSSNPYSPHQGALVLDDPLKDNSRGFKWDDTCQFAKDGYHISTSVDVYSRYCVASGTDFSNFAYEVQMTILKGDSGGIFLRGDADNSKFYYFRIDQTGYFQFIIFTGHTAGSALAADTTSAFHQGTDQSNLIGVVAQGDQFTLYINHQQVKTITNPTFSQGQIGLVVSDDHSPAEVVFTDAKVWKL